MEEIHGCPDVLTLQKFAAGGLQRTVRQQVSNHLICCDACCLFLVQLQKERVRENSDETIRPWQATPTIHDPPEPGLTTLGGDAATVELLRSHGHVFRSTNQRDRIAHIGGFPLVRMIGRGQVGTVLQAYDDQFHRFVAVKLLSAQLQKCDVARGDFLDRARAAVGIKHPNVAAIHAVAEYDGMTYFVAEYVPGGTLRELMRSGVGLTIPEIVQLGKQIADGLVAAHEQGVLQCDLRPRNVLLDGDRCAKISDFGLSLIRRGANGREPCYVVRRTGYTAPERAANLDGAVDCRADVYSLGVILDELLTDSRPLDDSPQRTANDRITGEPSPPRSFDPSIPQQLKAICTQAMANSPANRYQTAAELRQELDRLWAILTQNGEQISPWDRWRSWLGRSKKS